MIEAVQRVREAIGSEVFIVACFDQYPFSLACAMMGMDVTMVKLIDDRAMVQAVMERGLEYALAYARALADAGADMLSGGDSPAGLIGPKSYRDVALPFERRLIAALKSSVTVPVALHICGNSAPILGQMASSGADVLELDHLVNIRDACHTVGPEITIWGNLDPVGVLGQGTVDDVRRATGELMQIVDECGHDRFVLSSGCTLSVETPSENILAMFEAARELPIAQPPKRTVDGGI
jgi:MtaA/CmuA family methyltransferase